MNFTKCKTHQSNFLENNSGNEKNYQIDIDDNDHIAKINKKGIRVGCSDIKTPMFQENISSNMSGTALLDASLVKERDSNLIKSHKEPIGKR